MIEVQELNPVDNHIEEFLKALSVEETKEVFQKIVQKRIKNFHPSEKQKNEHPLLPQMNLSNSTMIA